MRGTDLCVKMTFNVTMWIARFLAHRIRDSEFCNHGSKNVTCNRFNFLSDWKFGINKQKVINHFVTLVNFLLFYLVVMLQLKSVWFQF